MKVLIVGSGGREHALAWKINQSALVDHIYCAPGNGGMSQVAECVSLGVDDFDGLISFAKEKNIDLTVVGPEAPLVSGIVDRFQSEGLLIFGPTKEAAKLEGSKVFSKSMMQKYGVPTAAFRVFDKSTEAKSYVMDIEPPCVIKADGLAAGKGVIVAKTTEEAVQAIVRILDNKEFGVASERIVIEDCIQGEELSILAFTDGAHIVPLASSQDHKRAYNNDEGPNTGGMGAYSPCPLVSQKDLESIVNCTIKPVIDGMRQDGILYTGLIYAGLMISPQGPMVLEYNVRFGDPETQAVLPRLKDDIVPLFLQIAHGALETRALTWDNRMCVNIVMASGGYPGSYKKGYVISGLDALSQSDDVVVFHAGTVRNDAGEIVTSGGRVLSVSALGGNLKHAQELGYAELSKITFTDAQYRTDIGNKAFQHIS